MRRWSRFISILGWTCALLAASVTYAHAAPDKEESASPGEDNEVLIDSPRTNDDFFYLASRYADFGDYVKAFDYARRAGEIQGETPQYHRIMAKIYILRGSPFSALPYLEDILSIERLGLPNTYVLAGDWDQYKSAREKWTTLILETYPLVIRVSIAVHATEKARRFLNDYAEMLHTLTGIAARPIRKRRIPGRNITEKLVIEQKDVQRAGEILADLRQMQESLAVSRERRQEYLENMRRAYHNAAAEQMTANEKAAQEWVRYLGIIIGECAQRTGSCPASLAELYEGETEARRPLIEMSGIGTLAKPRYREYEFDYVRAGETGFTLVASPLIPGRTGTRCFSTTGGGSVSIDEKCGSKRRQAALAGRAEALR